MLTPPPLLPPEPEPPPPEQTPEDAQCSSSLEAQPSHLSQMSGEVPSRKPAHMALKTFLLSILPNMSLLLIVIAGKMNTPDCGKGGEGEEKVSKATGLASLLTKCDYCRHRYNSLCRSHLFQGRNLIVQEDIRASRGGAAALEHAALDGTVINPRLFHGAGGAREVLGGRELRGNEPDRIAKGLVLR